MWVWSPYISQTQAGPQAVYDVLRQVRVVWIPHQPDGHDLRWVHQHPADTQYLPTVTLWRREREEVKKKGSVWSNRFTDPVLWDSVTAMYTAKTIPLFGSDEHMRTEG